MAALLIATVYPLDYQFLLAGFGPTSLLRACLRPYEEASGIERRVLALPPNASCPDCDAWEIWKLTADAFKEAPGPLSATLLQSILVRPQARQDLSPLVLARPVLPYLRSASVEAVISAASATGQTATTFYTPIVPPFLEQQALGVEVHGCRALGAKALDGWRSRPHLPGTPQSVSISVTEALSVLDAEQRELIGARDAY